MKLTVGILTSLCCLVFAEEEVQVCRGEGSWCAESKTAGVGLLQQKIIEGKFSGEENSDEEADQLPAPGAYQRVPEALPHNLQPVKQWTVELPVGTKLVLKNPKNSDGPVSLMQGMEDYKKGKTETSPFVVKGLSDWVLPVPPNADAELLLPAEGSGSDAPTTTEAAPTTTTLAPAPPGWVKISGNYYSPPEKTHENLVGQTGFPPGAASYCQNKSPNSHIMTKDEAEEYLASPLGGDDACDSGGTSGCGTPLGMTFGYTSTEYGDGSKIWFTNYGPGWHTPNPEYPNRWFTCVKAA